MATLPRSRWTATALVASLLLNGFLVGLLATDALRSQKRSASGQPRALGFELRQFARNSPDEDLARVRAELAPIAPEISSRLDRLRAIRGEISALAAERTPDRQAIDARLAELRAEVSAMQEIVQRATFDALLRLPPETRGRLAVSPDGG